MNSSQFRAAPVPHRAVQLHRPSAPEIVDDSNIDPISDLARPLTSAPPPPRPPRRASFPTTPPLGAARSWTTPTSTPISDLARPPTSARPRGSPRLPAGVERRVSVRRKEVVDPDNIDPDFRPRAPANFGASSGSPRPPPASNVVSPVRRKESWTRTTSTRISVIGFDGRTAGRVAGRVRWMRRSRAGWDERAARHRDF